MGCRDAGVAMNEFVQPGLPRAPQLVPAASSDEVKDLRREATALKEVAFEPKPANPLGWQQIPNHWRERARA
jgi:hypothetical protein